MYWIVLLGLGAALWSGARTAIVAVSSIDLPYATVRAEAFVLDGAMRVAEGTPLYLPAPNLTMHVYNPLGYLVPAALGSLVTTDPAHLLFTGRLVSLASAVLTFATLFFWAHRVSRSLLLATLAAALPLPFAELALSDFARLRPEIPALLCTVAAIATIHVFQSRRGAVTAAAILCTIAFMFKQSFVAAPIAIAAAFLVNDDVRTGARFAAMYTLGVATSVGLCSAVWGRAYVENVYLAMASNPWLAGEALAHYGSGVSQQALGLLAAGAIGAFGLAKQSEHRVLVAFWITSLLWNFVSAMKVGSNFNYFAEFAVASIFVSAVVVRDVLRDPTSRTGRFAVAALAANLIYTSMFTASTRVVPSFDAKSEDLRPLIQRYAASDRVLIFHEKLAIQRGHPFGYDWFLTEMFLDQHRLDYQTAFAPLWHGAFDTVVFAKQIWTDHLEDRLLHDIQQMGFRKTFETETTTEYRRDVAAGIKEGNVK